MIDPFARLPENEREELEAVLVAHQRHKGGCLCGWAKLGHSHPLHQADQILSRWRLVSVPKGHVREHIDPRRDIDPNGYLHCVKCHKVVGTYRVQELSGDYVIDYSSLGMVSPDCID